jgi:hypothetical protein
MFICFPDLLTFLGRLGERPDNVAIVSKVELVQGGAGGAAGAVQGTSPGCFAVTCKNFSMYGKRMRDVHMAGFAVDSDAVIRFRTSDGKVAVADLLVGLGRYSRTDKGQDVMAKLIDRNDDMVKDLISMEVDKSLTDMVSIYF